MFGGHDSPGLGVFEDAITTPGGMDVECPICTKQTPPAWHPFETHMTSGYEDSLRSGLQNPKLNTVSLDWMRCGNEDCEELIVRVHERKLSFSGSVPLASTESWIARPRFGESTRAVDPLVRDPYRADYLEAAAILDTSHRMSAVLARRIMGDLLKDYAGKNQKRLTAQIDAFTAEPGHLSSLTSNLHHFREVADFGAHTQEDQEAGASEPVIINVDREEAEWTLDLVDRLFDYFIVQPSKDEQIKKRVDEKIKRAGRKPLRPAEDE